MSEISDNRRAFFKRCATDILNKLIFRHRLNKSMFSNICYGLYNSESIRYTLILKIIYRLKIRNLYKSIIDMLMLNDVNKENYLNTFNTITEKFRFNYPDNEKRKISLIPEPVFSKENTDKGNKRLKSLSNIFKSRIDKTILLKNSFKYLSKLYRTPEQNTYIINYILDYYERALEISI